MDLKISDVKTTSSYEQPRLDVFGSQKDQRKAVPLHLDWVNFHGALYACQNWHYTGTIPASKTVKIGVWERGHYIGCVIYSRGANPSLGKPFGVDQSQICEVDQGRAQKAFCACFKADFHIT